MRFFFDYTTKDQSLRDYHGEEFRSVEDAFEFAETTAQDLKNNLTRDWMGWSVEVRDAEGTKYFSLPVETGLQATNADAEPDQRAKYGSLLVIEDEPIHSALISRIAGKVGFATTTAQSYEDACKVLGARKFDCITLDLGLGEHAGVDVLRYLSTIRCGAHIIVVSQADNDICHDVAELGRALDLNVCDSVPKPIDLEVLRKTLVRIQVQPVQQNASVPDVAVPPSSKTVRSQRR
jgi:two-component system, chemotaxis family, chemotaxis protein CheY